MKNVLTIVCFLTYFVTLAKGEINGMRPVTAVFVEFTSPGNGIDRKTFETFDTLLHEFREQGLVDEVIEGLTGREGEVTVCVKFKDVEKSRNFIGDLAPSISEDSKKHNLERMKVYLGETCDDVEMATEQDISAYL